jgi:hypothetical protein
MIPTGGQDRNIRNLATVGLKLLGILGIYWAITGISQSIFLFTSIGAKPHVWISEVLWLITSLITTAFAVALLARTDWIVAKLKFPEDPPSSGMDPSQLLRVGFVVLGAFTVIDALPEIGRIIYAMSVNSGMPHASGPDFERIISPTLKFILGCILIGKSDRFARSVFVEA